jgi:hypothetical protein
VTEEAGRLASLFPDAREHIAVKHEDTLEAWGDLLEKSAQRRDNLQQAEQLQAYFDEYRDLMLVCIQCSLFLTKTRMTEFMYNRIFFSVLASWLYVLV